MGNLGKFRKTMRGQLKLFILIQMLNKYQTALACGEFIPGNSLVSSGKSSVFKFGCKLTADLVGSEWSRRRALSYAVLLWSM